MKKIIVLFVCLVSNAAIFAQNEKNEGNEMAATGNYSGAAMMYRQCMQDEECLIELIRLLYAEKVEPQFTNELFQLVTPLAENGNAEAQFYLGTMYYKGLSVPQDRDEAFGWFQKSKEQGHKAARNSYDEILKLIMIETQAASPVFDNKTVASKDFGGGNGTQSAPYLISNAGQLKKLTEETNDGFDNSDTYYTLTVDIEVTVDEWVPIGHTYSFQGIFDGNGHTVNGTLKSGNFENFGLFGKLGAGARISNLTVAANVKHEGKEISTLISSFAQTGAIAGVHNGQDVIIQNCHVTGTVTGGIAQNVRTGGIIGCGTEGLTIRNCDVSNLITSRNSVGSAGYSQTSGIAGISMGEITNCEVLRTAKVTGGESENVFYSRTGGITGENHGRITDCTNHADVAGKGLVGGLAGVNFAIIHTSLNIGKISNTSGASSHSGNLVGFNSNSADFDAHIYACCSSRDKESDATESTGNPIGRGKAVEPCPDGHPKR